ncbi:hypothetical protein GCM10017668_44760 [Streptomyces tuirus]|uniref:Uncharacterized protein n=1 Tax=Streptomyces tuirus TaxID=68278 RepID=A0A7G1NHH9_9ACTN|nr:hypothetical protein GCM10017668_44760 [Streptomyces tuirus]
MAALLSSGGFAVVFVVITVLPRIGPSPLHLRPLCAVGDARYALPWAVGSELG